MSRLRVRHGAFVALFLILVSSSCDCEERIRKAVSRDKVKKTFKDSGESSRPSEEEPNDAREQATLLRLGSDLRDAVGRLESSEDVDWFSLKTESGDAWLMTLEVEPESATLDLRIELEVDSTSSKTVVYNSSGPGESETIRHLGVSDEVRRIGVSATDGSRGAYRVKFSRQLTAGAIEREPNDIRDAATNFDFPGEIEGFYGRKGDTDWYHVVRADATPGIYQMRVTSTGEFPQSVTLFTGRDAREPYFSGQVPPTGDLEIPNIRVPTERDGLWFSLSAGSKRSRKNGYRLRVVEHPPGDGYQVEAEPNDTAEMATGVKLGGVLRGYLHTPSDTDRVAVAVGRPLPGEMGDAGRSEARPDAGGDEESEDVGGADAGEEGYVSPIERVPKKEPAEHVVQAGLKPMSDSDRLTLRWWPDGLRGSSVTRKSNSPGAPVKLCNYPMDRGLLHLGIRSAGLGERDVRRGFTYEFRAIDIVSEVDGLEIEPNDRRDRADRLEFGASRTGYIARPGDEDLYAFGLPNPRRRRAAERSADGRQEDVGVRSEEPPPSTGVHIALKANELNLGFRVLDSEGGLVAEIDRNGAGADESTNIDLPPGLYYIQVESDREAICKPYELRVSRTGN